MTLWLALLAPLAHATDPGCIPQPAMAHTLDALLEEAGHSHGQAAPVEDKVNPDSYDRANGDNDGDGVESRCSNRRVSRFARRDPRAAVRAAAATVSGRASTSGGRTENRRRRRWGPRRDAP